MLQLRSSAALLGSLVYLLIATLAACGNKPDQSEETPPPMGSQKEQDPPVKNPVGVYPLVGLDPELPVSDLDVALKSLDGAEILGFGESIHTSEGYAEARVRVIRYLVEKKGVRAVAFESPWGPAETTRAFVERCEGTPAMARAGLTFRAWRSRATSGFLEWLCQYNKAHSADKVTLFGFDVQNPIYDGGYLRRFIKKVAPADASLVSALDSCVGVRFDSWGEALADPTEGPILSNKVMVPSARHSSCLKSTDELATYLRSKGQSLEQVSSHEEVTLASIALRSIRSFQLTTYNYFADQVKFFESRDEGMADNFDALRALRAPNKRVVIIAANDHIIRKRDLLDTGGEWDFRSMGTWLGERYGDEKYAPIGLFAYNVEFNWNGSKVEKLPLRKGTSDIEKPLHDLGISPLFVDLVETGIYSKGQRYGLQAGVFGIPIDHYRGLIFLEHSPPFVNP